MTLNKTSIEWTDYTWNPVTGCRHGCGYCYARRIAERFKGGKAWPNGFEPTFYSERLPNPMGAREHSKIFVCSMADLFGEWVSDDWIQRVIETTFYRPGVIFQFLTKNPQRYSDFEFPQNCWLGTTMDGVEDTEWNLDSLVHGGKNDNIKFVSFEPLLGLPWNLTYFGELDWIIIGAQTGPKAKPINPMDVQYLVDLAHRYTIPVFIKKNVGWPEKVQEFPGRVRP